jgi:hypothetical protein
MRDLSSSTWVIPRFLGKRVIKGNLAFWPSKGSAFIGVSSFSAVSEYSQRSGKEFSDGNIKVARGRDWK